MLCKADHQGLQNRKLCNLDVVGVAQIKLLNGAGMAVSFVTYLRFRKDESSKTHTCKTIILILRLLKYGLNLIYDWNKVWKFSKVNEKCRCVNTSAIIFTCVTSIWVKNRIKCNNGKTYFKFNSSITVANNQTVFSEFLHLANSPVVIFNSQEHYCEWWGWTLLLSFNDSHWNIRSDFILYVLPLGLSSRKSPRQDPTTVRWNTCSTRVAILSSFN